VKANLQNQCTDANDHIYVIQWPVTNIKASFCARNLLTKFWYLKFWSGIIYNQLKETDSSFVMAALWYRAGHYIFALWFLSFCLSFVISSPNLSGRRGDAGLKCAARGSLQIQDAKNRHLGTMAQLRRALSTQLRHVSTIGKKTC